MLYAPSILLAMFPILSSFLTVHAQFTCNSTSPCPSSAPCCSVFGFCGAGPEFCRSGGCDPLWSHTPISCEPSLLCKSSNYTFPDNSRILSNATHFNGNVTEYDWVVDQGNIINTNSSGGELALLLTKDNGGTRILSTRYLQYGTVTARLKTGRWAGVATAFVVLSDSKDEINWQFTGAHTMEAQTDFYFGGIPNYTNGVTIVGLTDTFANYHDYTIDWQPETLRFLIDDKEVRRVKKADVGGQYPGTPSRVQLSLWPAGTNTSPQGTIEWAGGVVNFDDPDYKAAGHFYATIQSISINCSDPAGSVPGW